MRSDPDTDFDTRAGLAPVDERPLKNVWLSTYSKLPQGNPPMYENGEELFMAALEYFDFNQRNPWLVGELKTVAQGANQGSSVELHYVPRPRTPTIFALCFYCGLSVSYWHEVKKKPEFSRYCEMIEAMIVDNKLSGAAANVYNAAIISKDLGLTEKTEVTGKLSYEERTSAEEVRREIMGELDRLSTRSEPKTISGSVKS